MELLKLEDNLTYQLGDVTFYFRGQMTADDKYELDMIGEWKNGTFEINRTAYFKKVVELFVTGWKGVTENGKDVPYSFHTLITRLPGHMADDWLLRLSSEITTKVGIFAATDERKNG